MFYFFTDLDLADSGGTYNFNAGPGVFYPFLELGVQKSVSTHLQIPTLMKSAAAYAICSGRVLVDDFVDTLNSHGTLILKPDIQPTNLPKIKYIIYKNVFKRSLVYPAVPGVPARIQPPYNPLATNQVSSYFNNLSLRIYTRDNNNIFPFYSATPADMRKAEIIDIVPKFGSSTDFFLEHLFENNNAAFQTFNVRGGDRLGSFNEDSATSPVNAGICIVLDTPHINLTLTQLRELVNGTNTGLEYYPPSSSTFSVVNKMKKDLMMNFLDPAAFYGNLIATGDSPVCYRNYADQYTMAPYNIIGSTTTVNFPIAPNFTQVTSVQNGYDTIMSKFANKNLVYIDIRNNEGNSYNFSDELVPDSNFPAKDILVGYNTADPNNLTTYESIDYDAVIPSLLVNYSSGNLKINGVTSPKFISPAAGDTFSNLSVKLRSGKVESYSLKPAYASSGLIIDPPQVKLHNDFVNAFSNPSPCAQITDIRPNETPQGYIYSVSQNVSKSGIGNFYPLSDMVDTAPTPDVSIPIKTPFNVRIALVTDGGNKIPIANYVRIVYVKARIAKPNFKLVCGCDPGDPYQNGAKKVADIIDLPVTRSYLNFESLDNFFQPFKMRPPIELNSPNYKGHFDVNKTFPGVASNVYFDEQFCDNMPNDARSPFMSYQGIAVDSGGLNSGDVTLFAFSTQSLVNDVDITDNNFKITGNVGASIYFLDQAIQSNGGPLTNLIFNRRRLLQADTGASRDYVISFIAENNPVAIKVGFLSTVQLSSFSYITIDKPTWKALVDINYGTTVLPNSGGTTISFIAPERTRLSFGFVKQDVIKAYDDLNPALPPSYVSYQKLELYLTGEVPNTITPGGPQTIIRSYPTGLYVFKCQQVSAPSPSIITSILPPPPPTPILPADGSVGNGYAIDIEAGVWRIKTTILLVPHVGVTDREMYFYKQFFECNIKQIWSNNIVSPLPYNNGLYEDSGNLNPPTSSVPVSSECIEVQLGTYTQLANLGSKQIGFLVCPDLSGLQRSYVAGNKRQGIMYFNRSLIPTPSLGRTRYFEINPANTPAHEFGHCMYLNDRYTYVANYNASNVIGTVDGHTSYMDTTVPIDTAYIGFYNWIFNLYSTLNYTKLVDAAFNDGNVLNDTQFNGVLYSSLFGTTTTNNIFYREKVATAGCTLFIPPATDYTTTYINPQQVVHARINASLNREEDVFYAPAIFFKMRWFVFFNNNPVAAGTFVGLQLAGGTANIRHDFGYSANASANADIMALRVNPTNVIDGYFSFNQNFTGTGFVDDPIGMSLGTDTMNNDVVTGGLDTVRATIDAFPPAAIAAQLQLRNPNITVNLTTRVINISGGNNIYQNIGYGNARGRLIWNATNGPTITVLYNGFQIRHSTFVNRLAIRQAVMPT